MEDLLISMRARSPSTGARVGRTADVRSGSIISPNRLVVTICVFYCFGVGTPIGGRDEDITGAGGHAD